MKGFVGLLAQIDKTELAVGLSIVAALGTFALWKKWFASRAAGWPIVAARIENVFIVSSTRGIKGPRYEATNAVLAYSYSIGDAFYSGEIKLTARYESGNHRERARRPKYKCPLQSQEAAEVHFSKGQSKGLVSC